jgi:predicted nucleic acid-binding protein
MTGLFRAKWTDAIHDEWTRNLLLNRTDLKPEQMNRTRHLMNTHVQDSLVTGYESLIPALTLPDPDDRHVLAAAIRAGASVIVTFNLSDFPSAALAAYRIEAQHPDEFLTNLLDLEPWTFCKVVREQRADLQNPPHSPLELLATLEKQRLPVMTSRLREMADLI